MASAFTVNILIDFHKHLCGILILLFLFFFPLQVQSALSCPKCGNLTVPFPLSTADGCGHPDYPVTCTAQNQLQVKAVSGNYTVLSVNSTNQTLTIATSAFLGSSCITQDSAMFGNFSLNKSGVFFITGANTILVYNCSQSLLDSPLNCSSASPCNRALETKAPNCNNLLCCSFATAGASVFQYGFPVRGQETAYLSVVDLQDDAPSNTWNYGIQLGWSSPSEPPCKLQSDCGSNSTCTLAQTSGRNMSVCMCNAGSQWDPISGVCSPQAPPNSTSGSQMCLRLGGAGFKIAVAATMMLSLMM